MSATRSYPRVRSVPSCAGALAVAAILAAGLSTDPAVAADEPAAPSSSSTSTLTLADRSISQDQGGWVVCYRLNYSGPSLTLGPSDITAKLEGWVSNSRVAVHAIPRLAATSLTGSGGLSGLADVVLSADEAGRCRERVTAQISTDEPCEAQPPASKTGAAKSALPGPLTLNSGSTIRVRVKLEHVHFLYGDYDPLLGVRSLELHLGAATLHDEIPLDREQYLAQSRATWPEPPEDRRDPDHFISAPDSLHLEAHVPGNQYYRFPERPVRYGTKMRLSYWYYIAPGTEGDCRARVAQYKDTPTAWKVLSDGAHEECLTKVGRWVKVERIFRTEADATTLALDFRITSSTDVGEMWIDDVTLEPACGGVCQNGP